MKRRQIIALFFTIFAFAWTNGNCAIAETTSKEQKEVMATLEQLATATVNKDVAALDKLYHKDLIFIHSSAQTQDKAEVLRDAPTRPISEMKYRDVIMHIYGNVALVNMNMDLKLVTAGKSTNLIDDTIWVLVKNSGRWQIVSRQATSGEKRKTETKP